MTVNGLETITTGITISLLDKSVQVHSVKLWGLGNRFTVVGLQVCSSLGTSDTDDLSSSDVCIKCQILESEKHRTKLPLGYGRN